MARFTANLQYARIRRYDELQHPLQLIVEIAVGSDPLLSPAGDRFLMLASRVAHGRESARPPFSFSYSVDLCVDHWWMFLYSQIRSRAGRDSRSSRRRTFPPLRLRLNPAAQRAIPWRV